MPITVNGKVQQFNGVRLMLFNEIGVKRQFLNFIRWPQFFHRPLHVDASFGWYKLFFSVLLFGLLDETK